MKTALILAATGIVALHLSAAPVDWSQLPPAATVTGVTFDKNIEPLFKASCVRCHSGDRARAQLHLDTLEGVMKGIKQGPIVVAGDSANSLLVKAVSQLDPQSAMPPKPRARRAPGGAQGTNAPATAPGASDAGGPPPMAGNGGPGAGGPPPGGPEQGGQPPRNPGPPALPLTAEQVGLVRAWIDQGAK